MTATKRVFSSDRTAQFTESVIREMTRLAIRHNAVNLAQGFPDFAAPVDLKQAAIEAIEADHNQYSITWGTKAFREAIACKYARSYNLPLDPDFAAMMLDWKSLCPEKPEEWVFRIQARRSPSRRVEMPREIRWLSQR